MASVVFLQGREALLNGTYDFLTVAAMKAILMKSTYAPGVTDDDIPTASEISGVSGYTGGFAGAGRTTLATGNRQVRRDDGNTRIELDYTVDITWNTLGAGDTIGGVLIAIEDTNDAGSTALCFDDTNNAPTNGGNVTWQVNAEGFAAL